SATPSSPSPSPWPPPRRCSSGPPCAQRLRRKELLRGEALARKALLVVILAHGAERGVVLLEAIRPGLRPHHRGELLQLGGEPRQHDRERAGVLQAPPAELLRLTEGGQQAARDPEVLLIQCPAQHDQVHDREDARPPVIVLLHLGVAREQPPHAPRAIRERGRP